MPTRKIERKWVATVTRAEGDNWPDIGRRHNSNVTFRPESLTIIFTDKYGGRIGVESAEAHGPRLFKSGPGAKPASERWFDYIGGLENDSYPEWVVTIAAEILADEILPQAHVED